MIIMATNQAKRTTSLSNAVTKWTSCTQRTLPTKAVQQGVEIYEQDCVKWDSYQDNAVH